MSIATRLLPYSLAPFGAKYYRHALMLLSPVQGGLFIVSAIPPASSPVRVDMFIASNPENPKTR